METAVREANLAADRLELMAGLRQHLNPKTDDARFTWLYEQNPHGAARVWVSVDKASGAIVGSSAALPRYFYVNGVRRLGCVLADSWMHPGYRYLGPAIALQRACIEPVRRGEFAIAYDFPQRSMIAVYQRLRIRVVDQLTTYEKIIRLDRYLGNRVRSRVIARVLTAFANPLFAILSSSGRRPSPVLEPGPNIWGAEFDDLAARTAPEYGVSIARTSDYLDWRFRRHFHNRYEMLVVRRQGRLAGYLIVLDDADSSQLNVMDFLLEPDPALWSAMIGGAARLCRVRGRSVLAISILAGDERAAAVLAAGFSSRRALPCVLFGSPEVDAAGLHGLRGVAAFTYGDEAD
jgi:hypothetical protein